MTAEPNPYEVWATTPGGWDAFTDELGDEDVAAGVELHQLTCEPGKRCSGCRGDMPAGDLVWADQCGWLWCADCARHCAECSDADCDHPRAVRVPWSADYDAGYRDARSDAWNDREQADVSGRHEAYRAGHRRGWAWAVNHPWAGAQ